MEKVEINIYRVNELSESGKKRAYDDWIDHTEYPFLDDNQKTLDVFREIFDPKEGCSIYSDRKFTGHRLAKYIINNYWDEIYSRKAYSKVIRSGYKIRHSNVQVIRDCSLTGYYIDEVILEPIYNFINRPVNGPSLSDLVREGISRFDREVDRDYYDYYSMDRFLEECEENEYRFLKNGTRIDNLM